MKFLFGGKAVSESETTWFFMDAVPELVWRAILFYEEVPGSSPLLLRWLRLRPIRTEGAKSKTGARILCRYKDGTLLKRITALEKPEFLQFEVIEQHLGLEQCVAVRSGSYGICPLSSGSEIALTTSYHSFLHPRWLWRPMEKLAIGQLHDHILCGMRQMILAETLTTEMASSACAALEVAVMEESHE